MRVDFMSRFEVWESEARDKIDLLSDLVRERIRVDHLYERFA